MSSGLIPFEALSRTYAGAEVACYHEAYLEMIRSTCGHCLFLSLGMNQGCCHTVINTTEDFPHMFDGSMAFFFTKNNSCLEHGGGLQLVSPQPPLQLHLHAWITVHGISQGRMCPEIPKCALHESFIDNIGKI